MAELFGFKFERIKDSDSVQKFTQPSPDDGTVEISGGGHFATVLDTDGRDKSEYDLVKRYRDVSQQPECDSAIEDIVNESIISNERDQAVSIILDQLPYKKNVKDEIRKCFDETLSLLDFDTKGHDIFRRWYVDGRLYYHKVIDTKNPKLGIMELRYIDPRKIKKVKEIKKKPNRGTGPDLIGSTADYYVYNEKGVNLNGTQGIRISPDAVTYVPSGLVDANKNVVLSYLQKAIKPVNQLRMIEDSLVIYRISRAPERRIFYIDVGNLPKMKAEQYLKGIMQRYRNKLVYDTSDGTIRDDRRHQAMLEDYWLPRREGGRGTEITTLPGGQNLGELEDIKYFQRKLYQSLHVPPSRLEQEPGGFQLGRAAEINRDELKFSKFVSRLRVRFNLLFLDVLKTQLLLKGVVTMNDWESIKDQINFDYVRDSHFSELKDSEVLRDRLETLQNAEAYIGKYYSNEWVRRNILHQNDDEIEIMNKQINQEKEQESEDEDEF